MAGKGRGIAAFTFNIEALGLTRGSMPETQRGPTPLFPQIEYKPGPLKAGEDEDYMRALKQEMRGRMKDLPFNIKPHAGKGDVEKYKEKYTREIKRIEDDIWTPDWNRLPKELKPQKKIIRRKIDTKKNAKISSKDKEELLSKLDQLEKKGDVKSDEEDEAKGEKKEVDEEGEEEEIEGEFDEELEEENDYIANYFEDGDDYGGGSDDNMDEATY
ncbi:DNA-directed RNA polymerase III subunit RPC7-like isoform X2 [Sinocyclocheilus anshuiensis]|uniref:DNA-directed RNA polymerase III subunit RPC7-like n=1 Tax=Sinocyclocheilus anshuiensis TaxID=1608454 RepID=A0A671KSM3_9TELE|nr:PREDICTED: DNA-directed RNA polymerase III subunit RPC7-like isoform X1 [Sinocyclocheilus anshuiensis]XP_016317276.1 PREDICTED: DNA-directed RNA polymerase III subunit RPC7-like isoform X2 [Sinocyclocheilus anshuiensis]